MIYGGFAKRKSLRMKLKLHKIYYLLALPGVLYFLIFKYVPMFGIIIAFKDVSPYLGVKGIFTSEWVGLANFIRFMDSYYFWNILSNTFIISGLKILFGFPAPIILALLINEIRMNTYKKVFQTISYLPHFVSWVVVAGILSNLLSTDSGIVNGIISKLGKDPIFFLGNKKYFRSILVVSAVWKDIGWGSIIYLAAVASILPSLYEAAIIDGANKIQRIWHITLPGILPVISIMFILRIGQILDAGFEQILLLYSSPVYKVADIIDTYVYREGIGNMKYSYSSAVGLFKSVIGFIFVVGTNCILKKAGQTGIW